jgi:outer membrane immunogenic protein
MRRRYLETVSLVALAFSVVAMPVSAGDELARGKSVFDWSRSYVGGTIGYVAPGNTAFTEVNDKFGVLGPKPQQGLMLSAEYGRLIDTRYDWRLTLRGVGVPEHIVDATDNWGTSSGSTRLGYQTLDGEIGRRIQVSDPLALRAFAGLRAIHTYERIEEAVQGSSNVSQAAAVQSWGIGPRAGVEFSYRLGSQPVFLTGGVDASVLFGRAEQTTAFVDLDTPMSGSLSSSAPSTIYTLGGRVGVTWFASPQTSVTVGYQAEQIWNLRKAYSGLAVFGDLGMLDGRGDNLVHGPFARVAVHFGSGGSAKPLTAAPTSFASMPQSWAGLKIGAHGGGALALARTSNATYYFFDTDDTFVFAGSGNLAGGLIGIHGGYDAQVGAFLAGVEVDWSWSNLSGVGKLYEDRTARFDIDSLASLRGRLGWTHENALFYVTGGAAWAAPVGTLQFSGVGVASVKHGYQGWVAGFGMEYRIAPRWSARAEYLRYGLGTRHYSLTAANGDIYSGDVNMTIDSLRVGLTYTLPVPR